MIDRMCVQKRVLVSMTAVLMVILTTLCAVQKASCEQEARPVNPPKVTNASPGLSSATRTVDVVTVLKGQLRQCEENGQALDKENDALRKNISDLQRQNAELQNKLNEFTKLGGSSVKAYCKSSTLSSNTSGATNNCSATGYSCEPVSGLCRTSCSATAGQCAQGFVCDTTSARCIMP